MLTIYLIGFGITTIVFAIDGAIDGSVGPPLVAIVSVAAGVFWFVCLPAFVVSNFVKVIRKYVT